MKTHAQKDQLVDDMLAIPVEPIQNHKPELVFEFEFVTPESPSTPADHLFLNGRLLPHKFPFPPTKTLSFNTTLSRSMSQTSSVSSKESLMSSRSNSTSSRSSSSTSTSTRVRTMKGEAKSLRKKQEVSAYRPSLSPQHGSWHYVTQTPVLKRKVSRKSRAGSDLQQGSKRKKQDYRGERNGWFLWRFWRWFLSTCSGCHAINPR
ncbi:hypothetical protein DCAR_0519579 [Daucus carota subsp. sativus]|uniref:Uncharacterized protein n=1 Tax=Daucus carota subsp. sativus TaxID=79200 RepID=A0A161ZZL2_DAUCS|nr:PREDICTED: pinin-like [Daucus carota subsp. sativus]WOH00221.1 hypothetical protein DCAR_0519579 [Daucus carota subsp. sativus]